MKAASDDTELRQGTTARFEMVGALMSEAASRAGLASDLNLSLVELYNDGAQLCGGCAQGPRFDIRDGAPSFGWERALAKRLISGLIAC